MKLLPLVFLPVVLASCQPAPVATTLNGTYTGRYLAEFSQDVFFGIPFARSERLRNPVPWNESWTGSRSAEWPGSICPCPSSPRTIKNANVTGVSDECLNLNIVRPSQASLKTIEGGIPELLPVAVWLYGGGFGDGFGADLNSNFSWVVQASVAQGMPIMAVTLNYRTGFLGFPGGHEAAAEGITNLGLKDQRHALRWVQENIAAFGGDPDKVTLWGQSAGANSIVYQLNAYGGRNEKLFRGAVMVSGSVGIGNAVRPDRADAVQGYRHVLNATGCLAAADTLDCLRAAPLDQVFNASASIATQPTWWPTIDGDFITKPPTLQLLAGEFPRDVSIIIGANDDEGFSVAKLLGPGTETEAQLTQLLRTVYPFATNTTLTQLLSAYPPTAPAPPYALPPPPSPEFCAALTTANLPCGAQYRRLAAILGDFALIHGRRAVARTFAALNLTAYSYRFSTWPTSFPVDTAQESTPGFAGHSTEYAYFLRFPRAYELYGNNPGVAAGSEAHLALSHAIPAKLVAFVYGGDPNAVEGMCACPD
jgi:carboxylesterase type B